MQRVYEENEWGKVSKRIVTISFFLFSFLFLFSILSWLIHLFDVVLYLFYCLLLLTYEKTHIDWAKMKLDNEVVRWWWLEIRGRVCKSGWCAHDSLQKVPTVRHLEEGHRGRLELSATFPLWPSPRCLMVGTFHRLSQAYQPLLHALPFITNHHHLTTSLSSFTFTQSEWVSS